MSAPKGDSCVDIPAMVYYSDYFYRCDNFLTALTVYAENSNAGFELFRTALQS